MIWDQFVVHTVEKSFGLDSLKKKNLKQQFLEEQSDNLSTTALAGKKSRYASAAKCNTKVFSVNSTDSTNMWSSNMKWAPSFTSYLSKIIVSGLIVPRLVSASRIDNRSLYGKTLYHHTMLNKAGCQVTCHADSDCESQDSGNSSTSDRKFYCKRHSWVPTASQFYHQLALTFLVYPLCLRQASTSSRTTTCNIRNRRDVSSFLAHRRQLQTNAHIIPA